MSTYTHQSLCSMQPLSHCESFGINTAAVFLLLAAVYLSCFTFVNASFPPLPVLVFVAVATLGLAVILVLEWVLTKQEGYQEQIATLTRNLTVANTATTNLATTVKAKEELCETAQGERDAAIAKVKARDQRNAMLSKDLRVANATIDDLGKLNADNDDKLSVAKTRLQKATAKNDAMKQHMVALDRRLAVSTFKCKEMETDLATKKTELKDSKKKEASLRQNVAGITAKHDATVAELKNTRKKVIDQKSKTATLATLLASATAERDATKIERSATNRELSLQMNKIAFLEQRDEDITAQCAATKSELVAEIKEVAAKDAVTAQQRLEISELRQMAVARGDANWVLVCILETTQDQLKDAVFHLEVQQLSGKAMKAKIARLQEEVKTLQCSMLKMQLPASTSCHVDDLASSVKDHAAAGTHEDISTGTLSTTPSPSDTASRGVSRSGSNGSMSNSDESGIVQPAVAASPISASPSPSPSPSPSAPHAEAAPAAIHTGPHNRPKRVRRPTRGQHNGHNRSSTKKVQKMQAGLFRGFS